MAETDDARPQRVAEDLYSVHEYVMKLCDKFKTKPKIKGARFQISVKAVLLYYMMNSVTARLNAV